MHTGEYDCIIIIIIIMADAEADTDEKSITLERPGLLQAGRIFPQGVRTSRDFSHFRRREGRGFGETLGSQAQCFDRMRRHCMGLMGWLTAG
jgi:hypothetical protein